MSSGSGIGGIFASNDPEEMGTTMQANAFSPIKSEKGRIKKWIKETGMSKPSDFHPNES